MWIHTNGLFLVQQLASLQISLHHYSVSRIFHHTQQTLAHIEAVLKWGNNGYVDAGLSPAGEGKEARKACRHNCKAYDRHRQQFGEYLPLDYSHRPYRAFTFYSKNPYLFTTLVLTKHLQCTYIPRHRCPRKSQATAETIQTALSWCYIPCQGRNQHKGQARPTPPPIEGTRTHVPASAFFMG